MLLCLSLIFIKIFEKNASTRNKNVWNIISNSKQYCVNSVEKMVIYKQQSSVINREINMSLDMGWYRETEKVTGILMWYNYLEDEIALGKV